MNKHNLVTQARLKELFELTDDSKFKRIKQVINGKLGAICGCARPDGYIVFRIDGRLYREHHLVWLWHRGVHPKGELDHIDHDTTNNRIENLREVTRSENMRNSGRRVNNTSGYKGVTWNTCVNKWVAQIWLNNKRMHLGCFVDPKDAYEAYCKKAIELHGEFVKLV